MTFLDPFTDQPHLDRTSSYKSRLRKAGGRPKRISLALLGGGAFGAST
jgi:hypothetical protein